MSVLSAQKYLSLGTSVNVVLTKSLRSKMDKIKYLTLIRMLIEAIAENDKGYAYHIIDELTDVVLSKEEDKQT